MLVKKITRTYSKSINSKVYGGPDSWIRLEATYEAEVESADDPKKASEYIYQLAKDDVIASTNAIIEKIKQAGFPGSTPAIPADTNNKAPVPGDPFPGSGSGALPGRSL